MRTALRADGGGSVCELSPQSPAAYARLGSDRPAAGRLGVCPVRRPPVRHTSQGIQAALERSVLYLGIEVDDELELAEQTKV